MYEFALRIAFGDKFGKRPRFIIADKELGWNPNHDLDNNFYGSDFRMAVRTDEDGYRLFQSIQDLLPGCFTDTK